MIPKFMTWHFLRVAWNDYLFTSFAGSCVRIRQADTSSDPAIRNRLESSECVIVFSHPTSAGLTNPARLPVELINAMPAAAPVPPRNDVGKAQNIGKAVITPEAASVRPSKAI